MYQNQNTAEQLRASAKLSGDHSNADLYHADNLSQTALST